MDKKGIELSVNFLVVIILWIVILTFSLILVRQIFTGAEDIRTQLDSQTDAQIDSLLTGNRRIAIPSNRKTIEQQDSTVYGLGVRNILKDNLYFRIEVTPTKIVEKGEETIIDLAGLEAKDWQLLYEKTANLVKNNELKKFPISIKVGKTAQGATVIFDVKVFYGPEAINQPTSYGTTEKIYVKVG